MTSTTHEFQSRWGFHPATYEVFLKLKFLHKWYWQTLYDFHRWHRWQQKEEQNRVGPEPVYCPVFVEDKLWRKPVKFHGEPGYKWYPKTLVDRGVLDLYRSARTPRSESIPPFDAETLQRIESLYEKVKQDREP